MANIRSATVKCAIAIGGLIGVFVLAATRAFALTPQQIFAKDSPSIVVVVAYGADGKPVELGSGVVIAKGEIVTNCHVVKNGTTLRVKHGAGVYPATLHFADFDRDLCQLSVTQLAAPPVTMGNAKTLQPGADVVAIGAPEGLELTISSGLISSLRDFGDGTKIIQTSAAISPGSSGGGLFDDDGRLVGITFAQYKEGQNLNFALPANWILQLSSHPVTSQNVQISAVDWVAIAVVLETKSDWAGLLTHARRWVQANPRMSIAWYALGEAQQHLNHLDDAERAYLRSLKLDLNSGAAWYGLGTALGQAGKYDKAVEALSQAVKFDPTEKNWRELGNAYAGWRHYGEATVAYHQALKLDSTQAMTWYFLGKSYYDSRQYELAVVPFQQALQLDPTHVQTLDDLGNTYGQLRRYAEAVRAFRQELTIDPTAQAWFNLGLAYAMQSDGNGVDDAYRHLRQLDPAMANELLNTAGSSH